MLNIAVVGDIHTAWNKFDVDWFNASKYDLILFTGDLPGRSHRGTEVVARCLAQLTIPAIFMPGNHDGVSILQLIAELQKNEKLIQKKSPKQDHLCQQLKESLAPVIMCGYDCHPVEKGALKIEIISARPHSMGGDRLSFYPYLGRVFGVHSLEESKELINRRINESNASAILFLAHNGPTGLGDQRNSIWGKDFSKSGGDFGDPDLRGSINYALQKGKQVLGVVAGHMHHKVRGLTDRPWLLFDANENIKYINAARVPRIYKEKGETLHHHIALQYDGATLDACEVLVSAKA